MHEITYTFSPRVELPFCKDNRNIFENNAISLLYNDQTN